MAGSLDGLIGGESSTINIIGSDGKPLKWTLINSLTYSENSEILEKIPMNGSPRYPKIHKGWKGTFKFFRENNDLMDYIIAQEGNYYLGGDQLSLSIHHSILEIDGSITTLQFSDVVPMLENAGDYNGTDIAEQTMTFKSARLVKGT